MKNTNRKNKIVAVSGGFDPVHIGHIRMMQEAKKMGDKLVVILNNDNWLNKKKGYSFMSQKERKEIIKALECVDKVVITKHPKNPTDMSVSESLLRIKPNIFCNGGDRPKASHPMAEVRVCAKIGCRMVFNIGHGGKIQSSSWLVGKAVSHNNKS